MNVNVAVCSMMGGMFLPHQSVQVSACSSGGFLLRAVGAEGPPVAS